MKSIYITIAAILTVLLVLGGCTPEAKTVTTTVTQPATTVTTTLPATTITTTVTQPATTATTTVTKTVTTTTLTTTSPTTTTTTTSPTTTTTTAAPSGVVIEEEFVGDASLYYFFRNLEASVTSTGVVVTGAVHLDFSSPSKEFDLEIQGEFYDAAGTLLGTSSVVALHMALYPGSVEFEIQFSTAEPSKVQKCILIGSLV